jgi:hypothetical protein
MKATTHVCATAVRATAAATCVSKRDMTGARGEERY